MDIEKTADLKCISRFLVEKWHVDQIKMKITVSPAAAAARRGRLRARGAASRLRREARVLLGRSMRRRLLRPRCRRSRRLGTPAPSRCRRRRRCRSRPSRRSGTRRCRRCCCRPPRPPPLSCKECAGRSDQHDTLGRPLADSIVGRLRLKPTLGRPR